MADTTQYETDDIYLAAYFMLCGCEMVKRKKLGNKVLFVFTNPAGSMQDLREGYYSGKAKVNPHQYSTQVQAFKKMCFE